MSHWQIWVIVAGILALAEVTTLTFVLGPFALAALAGAGAAGLGLGVGGQIVVFVAASIGAFFAVRPIARRHERTPAKIRTGVAALTGERAVVLEPIGSDGGRIKLAGEIWSARAFDEHRVIPEGAQVTVVEIAGATAIVME